MSLQITWSMASISSVKQYGPARLAALQMPSVKAWSAPQLQTGSDLVREMASASGKWKQILPAQTELSRVTFTFATTSLSLCWELRVATLLLESSLTTPWTNGSRACNMHTYSHDVSCPGMQYVLLPPLAGRLALRFSPLRLARIAKVGRPPQQCCEWSQPLHQSAASGLRCPAVSTEEGHRREHDAVTCPY